MLDAMHPVGETRRTKGPPMEVFKKSLSNVFANERRYVIPLFQRPYVWSRELQWEPLWDDIVDRAEVDLGGPSDEVPVHFLGAIVIQQRKSWGDEILAHDVIDGQQRLTTFQILLAALRDIATEVGDKQVAPWLDGLTQNPNVIANPETEQFKLWPTSRDIEQFRLVSSARSRKAIEAKHPPVYRRKRLQPRPKMVEAYIFFHDAALAWLREDGDDRMSERLRVLRRVIDKRLQLVSIELGGHEDPQAIFETLNARGVPLLASDLMRNFIFQRAGGPSEADRLHKKYWTRFEIPNDVAVPDGSRFWEMEERQGRLLRARLDLFVQHYLTMKLGRDVHSGRLYPEYKQWIEKERPFSGVECELQHLAGFADHFISLLRPAASTPVGQFANRLRALDVSTVYPLVLGLLGDERISEGERSGIYRDLESFLVRRLICGRSTKNYNRLFIQLFRDFNALESPTRLGFQNLLAAGTGENVDWPDDDAFEKAWLSIDAYSELKAGKVEMILRALEEAEEVRLDPKREKKISMKDKLTIEHVIPQSWKPDDWPLPEGVDPEAATLAREEIIHDFGNLTLLTQPLNSSVSNGAAKDKLPQIALESALVLNCYFQKRTSWSEADALERGRVLFQIAKRVWPKP